MSVIYGKMLTRKCKDEHNRLQKGGGNVKIKKGYFFSSRTISVIIVLIFISVMAIIFAGSRYMNSCIISAENARDNSEKYRILGEKLADASDYLTDEARRYSVTGDVSHLYNYWHEVYAVRSRDNVIEELSACEPPENEREMLEKAKAYSDMLINTETISMKLRLLADGKSSEDYFYNEELCGYVRMVEECALPDGYDKMSAAEMEKKSSVILYDAFYNESKSLIMTPIKEYQNTMTARLDEVETEASDGMIFASYVQIIGSAAVIILIGVLIAGINYFYIKPVEKYSDVLSDSEIENDISGSDFSKIRLTPSGSAELRHFGEVFNHLSLVLYKELRKRAEAEEEMRAAKEKADSASDAKMQFFAQMSHELRTPLNAVTGYVYLLEKSDLDDEQKKYTHGISIASDNLLGLINNVLDFSKIQSENMIFENVSFDIRAMLDEVYEMMSSTAVSKGIRLLSEVSEKIPRYVSGDPLRIRQVLINLVGNAVRFTEKGSVEMSATYMGMNSGRHVIEFGIRDSGVGIKKEDIEKVFTPFVQSDEGVARKFGGTGLGLPIADMIVRGMSGGKYHIVLSSEEGVGSYFRFKAEFENGRAAECEKNSDTGDIFAEKKILLVDDNSINLEIESEILKSFGFDILTADNGNDAINSAVMSKPDLILLDLHMPVMDGYETAEKMRAKGIKTPVIALTADVVSGTREKIIASGMDGYLSKPFRAEKLRGVISKHLGISTEVNVSDVLDHDKYFSIDEALRNLGGKNELLYRVVKKFLVNERFSGKYTASHIASGNYDIARSILHDIKGMAGNMCCYRLSEAAAKLHSEIDNGIFDHISEFENVWDATIAELSEFVSAYENRKTESTDNISYEDVRKEFLAACSDYDISAAEILDRYADKFRNNMDDRIFRKISEAVSRYDFDSVIALYERVGKNVQNTDS